MSKKVNLIGFLGVLIMISPIIYSKFTGTSVESNATLVVISLIIGGIVLIGNLLYYFIYRKK